jgi:hypothetical protein
MYFTAGLVVLSLSAAALAQKPIVYPAKGQSAQQQNKDDGECYVWARQNTGIDPAALAQTPAQAPPSQPGGERLRGAARGAVGGAAIGAIAGDTGKGAATGAVVGTMMGGREARRNEARRQEQAQQQRYDEINTFYRAYAACMQARGYTVN